MLYADLTAKIDQAGGVTPADISERAASTAEIVVRAARTPGTIDPDRLIALSDDVGVDTLAALWRDAEPTSLPGVLWTLYLLRHWCRSAPEEVALLWRAGEAGAPADAVVAGLGWHADRDAVRALGDAVLRSAFCGDFPVALERAAAFFRVVAVGRREVGRNGADDAELARRNERVAAELKVAAARWREGTLT